MKDLGGGAVLDLGIYMLQLVQFVYKEPPTDIVCTGHLSKAGVDESISCALKYKDGRTATLSAHTRTNMTNKAEITGTKGAVAVSQTKLFIFEVEINLGTYRSWWCNVLQNVAVVAFIS